MTGGGGVAQIVLEADSCHDLLLPSYGEHELLLFFGCATAAATTRRRRRGRVLLEVLLLVGLVEVCP